MNKTRFNFIRLLILILFAIAIVRAFKIAVLEHDYYLKRYRSTLLRIIAKKGKRGDIVNTSGDHFAIDYPVYTLFVDPHFYYKDIEFRVSHGGKSYPERVKGFIERISQLFGIPYNRIMDTIESHRESRYVVLRRNISLSDYKRICDRFIPPSFGFVKNYRRYYPDGEYSAHDIGFCFRSGGGAEGLERYYNDFLKGRLQKERVFLDALRGVPSFEPRGGDDLMISLNRSIQDFVHIQLKKSVEEHKARYGVVIVMDPYSGSIIAMDSYPYYNNNFYYRYRYSMIKNRAVADLFEPGSVFKLVTLAAALDSGKFKGNEIVFCENGRWKLGNKVIHDVHRFGWLSFRDVFVYSSNIGSAKIALKLGKKVFYRYLYRFGFGTKTGIDTTSEAKGLIKDVTHLSKVGLATMAFGQGISVTDIQLAVAYSAIANGGFRVRPHFMERISRGNISVARWKVEKRRILKPSTVKKIQSILRDVVLKGTGKRAALDDYSVAGKTGTAQVPKRGKYITGDYVASFAGYVPAEHPKFVIVVSIFYPKKGGFYGGVVAAPLFAKVAEFALHYYGVPKDK